MSRPSSRSCTGTPTSFRAHLSCSTQSGTFTHLLQETCFQQFFDAEKTFPGVAEQHLTSPATASDGAGSSRPAPSKGMLIACIAAWAVAVILCVAMTISLGAFNKAGRAVEESQQGVTDAQQAVDDANSLDLSGNGENE